MKTHEVTRIAFLSAMLACIFQMFANILYVEMITFTILLFACVFSRRDVILACIVFGCINMFIQGITIWSFLYVLIYPMYALLFASIKKICLKHPFLLALVCGLCSCFTGLLLDLPYLLFSDKVTLVYLVMGLKTSLMQGILSFVICMFLFDPLYHRLGSIQKEREN